LILPGTGLAGVQIFHMITHVLCHNVAGHDCHQCSLHVIRLAHREVQTCILLANKHIHTLTVARLPVWHLAATQSSVYALVVDTHSDAGVTALVLAQHNAVRWLHAVPYSSFLAGTAGVVLMLSWTCHMMCCALSATY
jgi:hypothetical protein